MKTALIIGITGNFGAQMARTLMARNWQVKALMRHPEKAPAWLPTHAIVQGDAREQAQIEQAATNVDLIVYAANPAYHRWHQEAMAMLEPTLAVATKLNTRILFPGNVYNFAPQRAKIDEQTPMNPPTDKGEIRLQMEQRLHQASEAGAKVTLIRAGDFLGPDMQMGWLDHVLKTKAKRVVLQMPHDAEHVHFWSYLPDLCANALSAVEQAQGNFEVFHDTGFALTTRDWQQAFQQAGTFVEIKVFPWWLFKVLSLASPMLREVFKMRYLWQQPVVLDGQKLKSRLGAQMQETSWNEVVQAIALQENIPPTTVLAN